ncbi:hypothetical protein MBLNU230_g5710t1 [Neophaeotheca triangularis]
MPPKDKYSDPKLRDQIKEELHNSDKGGQPGQWSARKAQLMAKEYKERGGTYNTDESQKDSSQQNLTNWGDEEWQTKDGSGEAREADGTEHRYLPKEAWENMTEEEKEKTDQKKVNESKKGKQHVGNTQDAKEKRKKASKDTQQKNGEGKEGSDNDDGDQDDAEGSDSEEEYVDDNEANEDQDGEQELEGEEGAEENSDGEDDDNAQTGQKRKQSPSKGQSKGQSKSQKTNQGKGKQQQSGETVGSKHQPAEEPAPKGSADRLPKVGQKVQWKALPGYVEGEVVEIVTEEKEVEGKQVKGSEKDPRVVLKSSSSGKIAVHKPDACFYE